MKKYKTAEMEIVTFDAEDVITGSNGLNDAVQETGDNLDGGED